MDWAHLTRIVVRTDVFRGHCARSEIAELRERRSNDGARELLLWVKLGGLNSNLSLRSLLNIIGILFKPQMVEEIWGKFCHSYQPIHPVIGFKIIFRVGKWKRCIRFTLRCLFVCRNKYTVRSSQFYHGLLEWGSNLVSHKCYVTRVSLFATDSAADRDSSSDLQDSRKSHQRLQASTTGTQLEFFFLFGRGSKRKIRRLNVNCNFSVRNSKHSGRSGSHWPHVPWASLRYAPDRRESTKPFSRP